MKSREEALREFVAACDIDVPESMVENELQYMRLDMRHRMRYDTLTGGELHLNPMGELAEKEAEMREAANYEVKRELVLKAVIKKQSITVTRAELETEAAEMAKRQNATVEQIKHFFGEDLSMLERDVKERKAVDWICENYDK